jgi:hypothetical protein
MVLWGASWISVETKDVPIINDAGSNVPDTKVEHIFDG